MVKYIFTSVVKHKSKQILPSKNFPFFTKNCKIADQLLKMGKTQMNGYERYFDGFFLDFADLQKRTRRSIKKTWQNYLSNDWLKPEKRKKMPLSKLYTDLVWTKKVRGIRDASQTMKSMYEIIEVDGAGEEPKNVLVEGKLNNAHYLH